mmetsp:Transcript_36441/g.109457  ORF Transcript_36441/g.109457 Transcript_36441/m.109457 type:complete len:226 (+) Transcript_36441:1056-1733(+)
MDGITTDGSAIGPMKDDAVDAVPGAQIVLEGHLSVEVRVPVPRDVDAHAVDDVILGGFAVPALPRTILEGIRVGRGGGVARVDGAAVVPADRRIVPIVIGVVVRYLVDVSVHLIPGQCHLDLVGFGIDRQALGQHDGRFGAGTPPRIVVHDRIGNRDVIPFIDSHAAPGTIVHDHVRQGDVIALPHGDAAGGVLDQGRAERISIGEGFDVGHVLVGTLDLQAGDF